jgi:hypothetical protein
MGKHTVGADSGHGHTVLQAEIAVYVQLALWVGGANAYILAVGTKGHTPRHQEKKNG